MSKRRSRTAAGDPLEKGPNDRNLCRWCKKEVSGRRRTFCSDECVHEYRLRSDQGYLRQCTFERDRGICKLCGLNTEMLKKIIEVGKLLDRRAGEFLIKQLGVQTVGWKMDLQTLWNADHIVPVVEGGGECGLENIQTACVWCHRQKTAEEAAERARCKKQKK